LFLAFPFLIGKGGARKLAQRLATLGDVSGDCDLVRDAANLDIEGFGRICCLNFSSIYSEYAPYKACS